MISRIHAVKALLDVQKLDALVCMTPENFTYVSDVYISTMKTIPQRQSFAIIPRTGDAAVVLCSIDRAQAAAESWIKDILGYTEFVHNPIDALIATLEAKGLKQATIGIDLDYLPATSFQHLTAALPGLRLVNTGPAIAAMRAIKSTEEIAILENAAKATHRAVFDAMAASRIGETELTMSNRIANGINSNGALGTLFVYFGSGERSALVHGYAGERVVGESELIRFDVGGTFGAWSSDFARNYSSGKPTSTQREVHCGLCEAQEATIGMMRPGVPAEDVYFRCREELERRGLPCFLPHIGHSFGLELHEAPMMRPGDKTPLAPGMVINIEPMTFDPDRCCYHTEDLVVITETGSRLLTLGLAPKELPVIGAATFN